MCGGCVCIHVTVILWGPKEEKTERLHEIIQDIFQYAQYSVDEMILSDI